MDTTAQPSPVQVQVSLDPARLPANQRGHFAARATLSGESPDTRLARLLTNALGGKDSPFVVRVVRPA